MTPTPRVTLAHVPVGRRARIRAVRHHRPEVARRLRELGISENTTIRCLVRGNGNMICQIKNMRIGLDNMVADSIDVVLLEEPSAL